MKITEWYRDVEFLQPKTKDIFSEVGEYGEIYFYERDLNTGEEQIVFPYYLEFSTRGYVYV